MRRPKTDGDTRGAADRLDDPHQFRRPIDPSELFEPRRKIGDPHRPACTIPQDRGHDGGVPDILRFALDQLIEDDVGEALLLIAGQQPAKDRIAVITREAPPHDTRCRIEECRRAAVADHGEIESVIAHGWPTPSIPAAR